MHIQTGFESGHPGHMHGPPPGQHGVTHAILFHPGSRLDEPFSRRVIVPPGTAALFTAHHLPSNRRVFVNQVTVGRDSGSAAADMLRIRMRLGGAERWVFTALRPQKIITLPGYYRMELEDQDMIDDEFTMEYVSWNLSDCPVQGLVVC
jgi:hypothetical protein